MIKEKFRNVFLLLFLIIIANPAYGTGETEDVKLFRHGRIIDHSECSGNITLATENDPFTVMLRIGENSYPFLIDSGSPTNRIYKEVLEKENDSFYSKTNSQGFKLHFLGSGFLGELEIQDQFFAYSPETESLPGLYGILGMNFLSQLKRITYHPQRHLIIMNDTNELAGITLPISKNGSPFYLTIQNTEGAVWLFDTGNYGLSALNSSLAKQLDIAKSLEKWEGNSHRFLWEDVNIQINYWYMPSYFLGEINLKNMLLRGFEVPENASWPGDWNPVRDLKGVLSNRLMLERSFQIDFNKELVRISGVPVFDEFHHQILRSFYVYGISVGIDFSRDEFVIHGIMQSSSLYKAGVRLGDRIPIAQLMDEGGRWRKILNDTGDYSYLSNSFFLDVVRGDQVLKIELQLELPFRVWLGR